MRFPVYMTNFMLSHIRKSPSFRGFRPLMQGPESDLCSLFWKGESGQRVGTQLWAALGPSNQPQSQIPEPPRPLRLLGQFLRLTGACVG